VSPGGALDMLGTAACAARSGAGGVLAARSGVGVFAGIAPAGPSAFIVACESGGVVKIVSD
jgi:hypothetical protein